MDAGKMTNLVLINIIDIFMFFIWFFVILTAPLIIILSTAYIIYELGWIGLSGPFLLAIVAIFIRKI